VVHVCRILLRIISKAVVFVQECRKFAYETGVAPVVAYGGAPIGEQLRQLERGCDILVATPGRLGDLIERHRVKLNAVCFCGSVQRSAWNFGTGTGVPYMRSATDTSVDLHPRVDSFYDGPFTSY